VKRYSHYSMIGLVGVLWLGFAPARADLEVSASVSISAHSDFYEPLTPHGGWIEVESYGRCWRPSAVAASWQPYSDGHWVWTDCGWYWVSDEPWAWACYHYGSWVHHPRHSWVWVPGVEWAPAWVSWRVGGGYVGWAPLPPPHIHVAPTFMFVETRRFRERIRPTTVVVNNTTIINKTTVISNVRREERNVGGRQQRVVVNEGPGLDPVQKATGEKVRAVPVQEVAQQTQVPAVVEQRTRERKVKGEGNNQKVRQEVPAGTEKPAVTPERKSSPTSTPEAINPGTPGKPVPPQKPIRPDRPEGPGNKPDKPDKVDSGNTPAADNIAPPSRDQPPVHPKPPGKPEKKTPKKQDDPGYGKEHGKDAKPL